MENNMKDFCKYLTTASLNEHHHKHIHYSYKPKHNTIHRNESYQLTHIIKLAPCTTHTSYASVYTYNTNGDNTMLLNANIENRQTGANLLHGYITKATKITKDQSKQENYFPMPHPLIIAQKLNRHQNSYYIGFDINQIITTNNNIICSITIKQGHTLAIHANDNSNLPLSFQLTDNKNYIDKSIADLHKTVLTFTDKIKKDNPQAKFIDELQKHMSSADAQLVLNNLHLLNG